MSQIIRLNSMPNHSFYYVVQPKPFRRKVGHSEAVRKYNWLDSKQARIGRSGKTINGLLAEPNVRRLHGWAEICNKRAGHTAVSCKS
jgi:hypothetical protein